MELLCVLYFEHYTSKDNKPKTKVVFGVPPAYNDPKCQFGCCPKYTASFDGTLILDFGSEYKCRTKTFGDKTYVVEICS